MTDIHPSAIVSSEARIGDDVVIEPYAIVDGDVTIGDGCVIGSSSRLWAGTRLGRKVRIFSSASVGAEPQDLKFGGEASELIIGDNTVVREFTSLHRGTGEGGRTVIGSECLLMAYSHVAHDCVVGSNVILANSVHLAGHVEIEDFAIIGGVVPVHQFVRIGRHSMVGGGFRVPKDVPPYILAGGYPLAFAGLNSVGLRRRGFSREDMDALKKAYQILYRSGMNLSQALGAVEAEFGDSEPVQHVIAFARSSKRGLIPGRPSRGASSE